MSFGSKIIILRDQQELSRKELSEKLGIAYQTLSKYETDSRFPDRETLTIIADHFDVSVDYLLGRTKYKNMITERSYINDLNSEGLNREELRAVQNMIDIIKKIKDNQ